MNYLEVLTNAAHTYNILPSVLLSICTVESNLQNVVRYNDGAHNSYGICQVQRPTARQMLGEHVDALALFQPRVNALVAAKYLSYQKQRYGNYYEAIAAYNSGTVKYREDGELINKDYLDKVILTWYNINRRY